MRCGPLPVQECLGGQVLVTWQTTIPFNPIHNAILTHQRVQHSCIAALAGIVPCLN